MPSPIVSRRRLIAGGAAVAVAAMSGPAQAAPFFQRRRLPIGIQLYTLGPDATADLDGTLAAIARIGYRTIELHTLAGRTPAQMRAALDRVGLSCTSFHIPARGAGPEGSFSGDLAKLADNLKTVGAKHCVMPSPLTPDRPGPAGEAAGDRFRRQLAQMTLEDWKANAELLNRAAKGLRPQGITVGYHNHNMEFAPVAGTTGMDVLLADTDRRLVTFEADVGWMAAAGIDPLAFIRKHRGRFSLMHVKDIKATTQPNFNLRMDPTEVGSGRLDWKTLLPGAYAVGVRHYYVEQEPPFTRPRIEAAKICHDFLAGLEA